MYKLIRILSFIVLFTSCKIPNTIYDTCAATTIGSTLYPLSTYLQKSVQPINVANKTKGIYKYIKTLKNSKNNHGFLLKYSTGSKAHKLEVLEPLAYANTFLLKYYYENII